MMGLLLGSSFELKAEGEKKGKMKGLQPITDQVDLVNSQCTVTK